MYQRFYPRGKKVMLYSWLVFGITGIFIGFYAFVVDILVEHLVLFKWQLTQSVLTSTGIVSAWLIFLFFSVLFGGIAAVLTIYVGPGA